MSAVIVCFLIKICMFYQIKYVLSIKYHLNVLCVLGFYTEWKLNELGPVCHVRNDVIRILGKVSKYQNVMHCCFSCKIVLETHMNDEFYCIYQCKAKAKMYFNPHYQSNLHQSCKNKKSHLFFYSFSCHGYHAEPGLLCGASFNWQLDETAHCFLFSSTSWCQRCSIEANISVINIRRRSVFTCCWW